MWLPGCDGGAAGGLWQLPLLLLRLGAFCEPAGGQEARLPSGQAVCLRGTQRPCYKIVYFHEVARRVGFQEALQTCRSDGADLVSIESQSEQVMVENMIQRFSASDGDFWIGLRREDEPENGTECPSLYTWTDGSSSTFRNWYADEPSCGSEWCVVMYHQPSAPAGDGGRYLFQWNDDRCNMKNNFICKYSEEKPTVVPELAASQTGYITGSSAFTSPEPPMQEAVANKTLPQAKEPAWSLLYILISSIPALLLLIAIAVFIFWVYAKRKREQREENTKEKDDWSSTKTRNSPSLEIYNVIKTQGEADLDGTRPQTQNSSFRVRLGGEDLCGDYDNMVVNNSESGFVTLASTESGFVTNDIYELCHDRVGPSKESAWVENEIYGY
ncbi:layilin isoform X1 [Thamnophis elegans]|uniref:layilin isoform X1 n=1 Tax=Thamnophis elegans TaxID=35005 RepID=UPI00137902A1|nr:layilin isoform X1 [Thamnophis elegans]